MTFITHKELGVGGGYQVSDALKSHLSVFLSRTLVDMARGRRQGQGTGERQKVGMG